MRKVIRMLSLAALFAVFLNTAFAAEEGMASYYADSLHGNTTASGQPYDKGALTAAHRTLEFGTRVKVTNLDNDQAVTVVINDRGPHVKSRVIDVSGEAARQLGMLDSGTARVRLEVE